MTVWEMIPLPPITLRHGKSTEFLLILLLSSGLDCVTTLTRRDPKHKLSDFAAVKQTRQVPTYIILGLRGNTLIFSTERESRHNNQNSCHPAPKRCSEIKVLPSGGVCLFEHRQNCDLFSFLKTNSKRLIHKPQNNDVDYTPQFPKSWDFVQKCKDRIQLFANHFQHIFN